MTSNFDRYRARLEAMLEDNFPAPDARLEAEAVIANLEQRWCALHGTIRVPDQVLADIFDAAAFSIENLKRESNTALENPALVRLQAEAVRGKLFDGVPPCDCRRGKAD